MAEPEFSFASLIKPGEGAMQALRSHLRVTSEREHKNKPADWRYAGVADFLEQHGTFSLGRELPDQWEHLRRPQAQCHDNALAAAEADPTLRYFTGLYVINREPTSHSWCVDANGELLEFTLPNAAARGRTPVVALDRSMAPTSIPMLSPPHWGYVGVEYETAFVREHADTRGMPLLDPYFKDHNFDDQLGCYLPKETPPMWVLPYHKAGFPVPPAPEVCTDCLGRAENPWTGEDCVPCGAKGWLP